MFNKIFIFFNSIAGEKKSPLTQNHRNSHEFTEREC